MLRKQDEAMINAIPHQLLEKYDIEILSHDEVKNAKYEIINDSRANQHEQYASEKLLKNITLVAFCDNQYYGYWHGKDADIPLEDSPVVLCDPTGISLTYVNLLYSIVHDMTISKAEQEKKYIESEFIANGMHLDDTLDALIYEEENDPFDIFCELEDDSEFGRALKEKPIQMTKEIITELEKWCNPRFGESNPTRINSALLWGIGVLTRDTASMLEDRVRKIVKKRFSLTLLNKCVSPIWSFDRFGKSVTRMPDGREIHIAGEHEDWYDENFYIYNDVIEIHPDDTIVFYTYPESVFPPTDSHSATLVGDEIIIIGSIGYESIVGYTPVYKLNTNSFKMTKIETTGNMPGWIYKHRAKLCGDEIVITDGMIDYGKDKARRKNTKIWSLDIRTYEWTCVG